MGNNDAPNPNKAAEPTTDEVGHEVTGATPERASLLRGDRPENILNIIQQFNNQEPRVVPNIFGRTPVISDLLPNGENGIIYDAGEKVGIHINHGISEPFVRALLGHALKDAIREPSSMAHGEDVYNFGMDADPKKVRALARDAAGDYQFEFRIKYAGVEVLVTPGMTDGDIRAMHYLNDAHRRATQEYFTTADVSDPQERAKAQSEYMRSNVRSALNIFERDGVSQERLLELAGQTSPEVHKLMLSTQNSDTSRILPLSAEENENIGQKLQDRFYRRAEEYMKKIPQSHVSIEIELGKPRQASRAELNVGTDRMTAQDLEKLSSLAREQVQSTDPAKQQEGRQTLTEIERAQKGDTHAARLVMGKWKGIATALLGTAGLATGLLPGQADANDFHRLGISGR